MITKTNLSVRLLLFLVAASFSFFVASARPQTATDTNIYTTFPDGGDDDGVLESWYSRYYFNYQLAMGPSEPMPEQLPAARDTKGHWGELIDGMQLSVRFHQGEFKTGEPVRAMILLRNVGSSSRKINIRTYGYRTPEARKNFAFILRSGTNVINWRWSDPNPPDPVPNGYMQPRYFMSHIMEPHSQAAFFVRVDQIYDLSKPGEYSIQVIRTEPLYGGQGTTNVVSGTCTFRVVQILSESEIAARKVFTENLRETEVKAMAVRMGSFNGPRRAATTNAPGK